MQPYKFETRPDLSVARLQQVAARCSKSSPGPDGLQYAAWAAAGTDALRAIRDVVFHTLLGGSPPQAVTVILPKESPEEERGGVVTAPTTRPMTLRNSDAKLAAAWANTLITPALQHSCIAAQHGFVRGRQPANAILVADTAMHRDDGSERSTPRGLARYRRRAPQFVPELP